MSKTDNVRRPQRLPRRAFLQAAGGTTLALSTGEEVLGGGTRIASAMPQDAQSKGMSSDKPFNILFILTDQERYFHPSELPAGYRLQARERLQRRGVTFTNHQVNSMVCTSSRSVIYTGQHIQHTKLFDNMDFPWMKDMSHDIPTLGNMVGEAGYYPAYKVHALRNVHPGRPNGAVVFTFFISEHSPSTAHQGTEHSYHNCCRDIM